MEIYVDGSHHIDTNNTPLGGWACLINGKLYQESGSVPQAFSTELESVILALRLTRSLKKVTIYCDNKAVVEGLNKRIQAGLDSRKKQGKCAYKSDKKRWRALLRLTMHRTVTIKWVKAHNGNRFNEIVDKAAKEAKNFRINWIESPGRRIRKLNTSISVSLL